MSIAPLGVPVVPLVYWMIARSSVAGRGCDAGSGSWRRSWAQGSASVVFSVRAARASRAFATGRRRATRMRSGIARVTSTDTRVSTRRSAGKSCTVFTTLLHTMACFAP